MIFIGVISSDIDSVWDQVKPEIQKALDRDFNRTSINTVYDKLKSRDHQLWVCKDPDCVFVTGIFNYDNAVQLRLLYAGGSGWSAFLNKGEIDTIMNIFKRFALSKNCSEIEIWGREGWMKIIDGLNKSYTVMRLKL